MIWERLTTPEVRDLAWACFSPPLLLSPRLEDCEGRVDNCALQLDASRVAWLEQLDSDPGRLLEHLSGSASSRLGIYFERLWHFFLLEDPDLRLYANNLPVRANGRTLGEYDCIYYCLRRERYIHLELAVKFYLETTGSPRWLGPGCRDSLEEKTRHMTGHQVRLSATPAGRQVLDGLGIDSVQAELEMKGYLFGCEASPTAPAGHNAANRIYQWTSWSSFPELADRRPDVASWRVLPRRRWLAPCDVSLDGYAGLVPVDQQLLQDHFSAGRQALLIAGCAEDGGEILRHFLTPDNWPLR